MKGKRARYLVLSLLLILSVGLYAACATDGGKEVGVSPTATNFISGKTGDLVFLLGKDTGDFTLTADGAELDAEHYAAADGQLTLRASYLSTLARGEHTFVLRADGEDRSFRVTCYAQPAVTPETARFDWLTPEDVTLEADLGGAQFVSLTVGGEALKSGEYTFSGSTLTISREAVEMRCSDGDNLFTLNTTVTSTQFTLNCYYSDASADFDGTRLKIQSAAGSDVRFRFNPYAQAFTVSALDQTSQSWTLLTDAEYSWSSNQLSIAAGYLDGLYCDFLNLRVDMQDDAQTAFDFCVVPYGKGDSAHPAASNTYAVNNFDALQTGSGFCGTDVLQDAFYTQGSNNRIVEGASAIDGKSLELTSVEGAGINTLLGVRLGFGKNVTYYLEMKYRLSEEAAGKVQVVFKWAGVNGEGEDNFLWMAADQTVQSKTDERTSAEYDASTGVVTVKIYTSTAAAQNVFQILTVGDGGSYSLTLDELRILETSIPAESGYNPPASYEYNREAGGDLEIDAQCTGSLHLTSVVCDGAALVENTDYTVLSDGTLVLKETWLSGRTENFALTLTRSCVKDILGGRTEQSAVVEVSITDHIPAAISGDLSKVQTAAEQDLEWSVTLGDYHCEGVTLGEMPLAESDYTLADGVLTIRAAALDAMTPGLYEGRLLLSDGNSLVFHVGVYDNADAHLISIGAQNFENAAVGATLADLYGGAVTCWPDLDNKVVKVVRDAALGKALSIPASLTGADHPGILDFKNLDSGSLYRVTLRFRTENDEAIKSLLLKWLYSDINASWIKNDAIDTSNNADIRNSLTKDEQTGVYTWISYLKPTSTQGDSLILWAVEAQGLTIGSIEIVKTNLSFVDPSEGVYRYYDGTSWISSREVRFNSAEQELAIVENVNVPAPFSFAGLYAGETALTLGTDYRLDGDRIVLLPAYLAQINSSVELTVRRSVAYLDGSPLVQSAKVTVTYTAE